MKNRFTKNIGLKIISLIAAFFLWIVVVNVDDPVISRTYSGIQVELLNTELLTEDNKSYEVLNNTDTVNVVVSAQRSVLDEMSKDYIKATADFADLAQNGTVPIEVKSTRYSDKIESVSTRTESLKLIIEDIISKACPVMVEYEGNPADGFALSAVEADITNIEVSGPQSLIDKVAEVKATYDITGIAEDMVVSQVLYAYDEDGEVIEDQRLIFSDNVTQVTFKVDPIKEIPISAGYSGDPVSGYAVSGTVSCDPDSVLITGRGENFDDIDVIYISPDAVSIDGAMANVQTQVDISEYLPTGVSFAEKDFDPVINVEIPIAETQSKVISVPAANITIENIPEGYVANIVDIGGSYDVEIQGLGDTFDRYSGDLAIGTIDALSLLPRNINEDAVGAPIQTGENDGLVTFDLPTGITLTQPLSVMVIVDYVGIESADELSGENVEPTTTVTAGAAAAADVTATE